jgi:pimeloyl-ACP methyl ester carboxylesterase
MEFPALIGRIFQPESAMGTILCLPVVILGSMTPTYAFVHASTGNSRGWSVMQREMAFRGFRSLAVDLPGRGAGFTESYVRQDLEAFAAEPSALAGVTAADTIGVVVDAAREHGPVVLVGHSLGGLAISGAANLVPDLIDRIVYIAAICPVDRVPADYVPEYLKGDLLPATAPLIVGDPAKLGFVRVNWRAANPAQTAALKHALNAESADEGFLWYMHSAQPDETLGQWDPGYERVRKDAWGRIPRTFIRLTKDNACPLAVQDIYIAEGDALTPDNPWDVRSVESSHGGFLTRPEEVANILASLS